MVSNEACCIRLRFIPTMVACPAITSEALIAPYHKPELWVWLQKVAGSFTLCGHSESDPAAGYACLLMTRHWISRMILPAALLLVSVSGFLSFAEVL